MLKISLEGLGDTVSVMSCGISLTPIGSDIDSL